MLILIKKAKDDKITMLQQRLESIKARAETEKEINNVANQIASCSPAGYAAIDSVRGIMEKSTAATVFERDSEDLEKAFDLRIAAFQKAHDLAIEFDKLHELKVSGQRLMSVSVQYTIAAAHVHKILVNSPEYVYMHPDQPKSEPVAPAKKPTPTCVADEKSTTAAKVEPLSFKHMIARRIGWDRSVETNHYPGRNMVDADLCNACLDRDASRACKAIIAGATDFDGGLAHACYVGDRTRALHMLNLGAKDVQLGLACGLWVSSLAIIKLMIARGAKVNDRVITYAATLKLDSICLIVHGGWAGVDLELRQKICDDPNTTQNMRDHISRYAQPGQRQDA